MNSEVRPNAGRDATGGVPAEEGRISCANTSRIRRVISVALCAFLALAFFSLSITLWLHVKSTASTVRALQEQIDYLELNQGLLIAEVRAGNSSGKAAVTKGDSTESSKGAASKTSSLLSVNATESALGIQMRVGKIEELKREDAKGWLVKYQMGNYTEGKLAMIIASNHGDVFNGEYYVLKISNTPQGTLLRNAKFEVYGWNKTPSTTKEVISAEKFISAIKNNDAEAKVLKGNWFRFKVTPYGDIMAAQQLPPTQ